MPTNRRHHTVPRLHLRRFADSKGHVRVWRAGRVQDLSLADISVRADFYTRFDGGVRDLSVDDKLQRIEDAAAPVIERLLDRRQLPSVVSTERLALSEFLAIQLSRSARERREMEMFAETFLRIRLANSSREMRVDVLRSAGQIESDSFARFRDGEIEFDALEIELDPNGYIDMILPKARSVHTTLLSRPWQVWTFEDSWIVTSDDPMNAIPDPSRDASERFGLKDAFAFAFPLDRNHALMMPRVGEPEGFFDMPRHAAQTIRSVVVAGAHEEIYSHPLDDLSWVSAQDVGSLQARARVEVVGGSALSIAPVDGVNQPLSRRAPRRRRGRTR